MDGKSKDNHRRWELQSWTKVLWDFCIYGAFFSSYIKNTSLTSQTYVGRVCRDFFSEFQHCVGWGDGKLQENFEKDALFREGTEK